MAKSSKIKMPSLKGIKHTGYLGRFARPDILAAGHNPGDSEKKKRLEGLQKAAKSGSAFDDPTNKLAQAIGSLFGVNKKKKK